MLINNTIPYDWETFMKNFCAGSISAAVSRTVVAPLERVKLLLQLQSVSTQISADKQFKGIFNCLSRLAKEQGVLSFWRGSLANIIFFVPSQALNFAFKEKYKSTLQFGTDKKTEFWPHFAGNLASGAAAGATTLCIVFPLEFSRTRVSTDIGGRNGIGRQYTGMSDCISKTLKSDGVSGLYRGLGVGLHGVIIYRACYFGLYDTIKESFLEEKHTPFYISFIVAQCVTTTAGMLSYPFDSVCRRMMMQSGLLAAERRYKNTIDCWRKVGSQEGIAGFFHGAWSNVVRGTGGALMLILYDEVKVAIFD